MDEHELNALLEKLRLGIALTDVEMAKLASSLTGATTATAKFQKAMLSAAGDLTKSMTSFAASTDTGAGNFKSLNPVIDAAGRTAKGLADAFGSLGDSIPVASGLFKAAGKVMGVAAEGVAEGSKFLVNQLQQSADAFNDFAKVGALTVKGMTGVQEQFIRSGMQLSSFTKSIADNADTLARFRGQVGAGADDFSKVIGDIIDSDVGKQLRRIGFSADQIGEGAAGFVKQQTQLGMAQKRTNAELSAGAVEYLKQQDLLAKATGMSRKAIEDQQQAALSEGRFRAQTDEMIANGQEKQAKTLLDFQSMVSKAAPEMAAGLRDAASGFVSSSSAQKLYMDTGGKSVDILAKVNAGTIDQFEAFKQLQSATRDQMQVSRDITKVIGDEGGTWSKYADRSNLANAKIINGQVELADAQKKQMEKGTDPLTDSAVSAQESMQQMNRQMQQFGFTLMPQAAKAIESFTSATNDFLKFVAKVTGTKIEGLETQDDKNQKVMSKTEKVISNISSVSEKSMSVIGKILSWMPVVGLSQAGGAMEGLADRRTEIRTADETAEATKRLEALSKLPKFADGGITKGLSFAGEAGPEAVIPLKGGKVPVDFGSGLSTMKGAGNSDLATVIPPLTKAIIPFTAALNSFTEMTQRTAKADTREGEEARKGESMFDKMVSFIGNLFGPGGAPGGAKAGAAPAAGDMTAAMNAHDASHKHEPPTVTPEAAKQLGKGLGSPLEDLKVTSGFGMRTDPITGKQAGHGGVDLAGKIGDAIKAPEAGTARVVGEAASGGYGNMVEILDSQGKVMHRMAHMSETMVKTGDKIEAGAQIGKVGNTGRSTGAHLHWEQFDPATGKQIDPMAALAAKQGMTPGFGATAGGAATGNPQATQRGQNYGAPQASSPTDMATYMKTVAMLESGGNPNAKAGSSNGNYSSAGGLFQFLESSYEGVTGRKGSGAERFDPAKATEAMQKMTMMNKGQMEKGLGREVSGEDLYMGHFLGAGGATKFLKAKDQDPSQSAAKFDPTAAASNKSIYYDQKDNNRERSMAEVHELMTDKYRKQQAAIQGGQKLPDVVAALGTGGMTLAGGAVPSRVTAMPGGAVPGAVPGMPAGTAVAGANPAQSPLSSIMSAFLGPQLGGGIAGLLGGDAATGGMAGPVLPGAPSAGGGTGDLIAAIKDQGQSTANAITTSIASLKDSIGSGGSAGGEGGQVPELLNQLIGAQRDQTAAINRLIQAQTA